MYTRCCNFITDEFFIGRKIRRDREGLKHKENIGTPFQNIYRGRVIFDLVTILNLFTVTSSMSVSN